MALYVNSKVQTPLWSQCDGTKGFSVGLFLEKVNMEGRNLVLTVAFEEAEWGR